MNYVTLLMISHGNHSQVMRAFKYWEDAQNTADKFNEIILKEGIEGICYTKTMVVE